jgi:hypothetical protein
MEGLRGIAVFLVFLVHYVSQVSPWTPSDVRVIGAAIHTIGATGVDLFFVLSGSYYLIHGLALKFTFSLVGMMVPKDVDLSVAMLVPAFVATLVPLRAAVPGGRASDLTAAFEEASHGAGAGCKPGPCLPLDFRHDAQTRCSVRQPGPARLRAAPIAQFTCSASPTPIGTLRAIANTSLYETAYYGACRDHPADHYAWRVAAVPGARRSIHAGTADRRDATIRFGGDSGRRPLAPPCIAVQPATPASVMLEAEGSRCPLNLEPQKPAR